MFRFVYPYFFDIKDASGQVAARLNLTLGPFMLDWVKTTKKDDKDKVAYVTNPLNKVCYSYEP